jgi:hypothetical protein
MLYLGVLGGLSATNCIYYVLNSPKLNKNEKEITINIQSMFSDAGILMANLFALAVSNFILPN